MPRTQICSELFQRTKWCSTQNNLVVALNFFFFLKKAYFFKLIKENFSWRGKKLLFCLYQNFDFLIHRNPLPRQENLSPCILGNQNTFESFNFLAPCKSMSTCVPFFLHVFWHCTFCLHLLLLMVIGLSMVFCLVKFRGLAQDREGGLYFLDSSVSWNIYNYTFLKKNNKNKHSTLPRIKICPFITDICLKLWSYRK